MFSGLVPAAAHSECCLVEPVPAAGLAGDVHVGQEVHLDEIDSAALARLAAAAFDVERESPRRVAVGARLGRLREQLADCVEDLGVRRRVQSRGAADGPLVDVNRLVEVLEPADGPVFTWSLSRVVQALRQRGIEDVVDQRGLARAGDTGHGDEEPEREVDVEALQVVLGRALDAQLGRAGAATLVGHLDPLVAREIRAGHRLGLAQHLREARRRRQSRPPSSPAPGPK